MDFDSFKSNIYDAEKESPMDMHCPLMGSQKLNYWKKMCKLRQKNPELHKTCYPHCKCKDVLNEVDKIANPDNTEAVVINVVHMLNIGIKNKKIAKELGISNQKVAKIKHMAKEKGILKK